MHPNKAEKTRSQCDSVTNKRYDNEILLSSLIPRVWTITQNESRKIESPRSKG